MQGKTYIYKHYAGGVFVGELFPTNEFSFTTEVNTASSEMFLTLPVSFESTESTVLTDLLVDESGNYVVDENSNNILLGVDFELDGIPRLNDRVEVWEFTESSPSGEIIYQGLVSEWSVDYENNRAEISLLSYGIQLDNYLVQILPDQTVAEQDQEDSEYSVYGPAAKLPTFDRLTQVSQTFSLALPTSIYGVFLNARRLPGGPSGSITARIQIVEGLPTSPGTVLATRDVVTSDENLGLRFFQFTSEVSIAASTTYHIAVTSPFGSNSSETNILGLSYLNSNGYADGQVYLTNEISGITTPGTDLFFRIVSSSGGVGSSFSNEDPSNIVRSLLDNFASLGGVITYTEDSIQDTGVTVSYTFSFNTYFEALKICAQLAPANWHFYVDPATNVLYFLPKQTEKAVTITRGTVVGPVIKRSLEQMKNIVYFSGGEDDLGVNVTSSAINTTSTEKYGQWLDLPVDARVTVQESADAITSSVVDEKSLPRFSASDLTLIDTFYDLNSFKPGDIVGFQAYNEVINSLELQILRKNRRPNNARIVLEVSPPSPSRRVDQIRRELLQQQTLKNPDLAE
jgi:hypothetical protein